MWYAWIGLDWIVTCVLRWWWWWWWLVAVPPIYRSRYGVLPSIYCIYIQSTYRSYVVVVVRYINTYMSGTVHYQYDGVRQMLECLLPRVYILRALCYVLYKDKDGR